MLPYGMLLLLAAAAHGTQAAALYKQQQYVVSGCLDPPLTDAAYSALAGANFSGVFGERTATTPAGAAEQGALCAKHGMPACFPGHAGAEAVPLGGSIHGYYLKDEPHAWDFKNWAKPATPARLPSDGTPPAPSLGVSVGINRGRVVIKMTVSPTALGEAGGGDPKEASRRPRLHQHAGQRPHHLRGRGYRADARLVGLQLPAVVPPGELQLQGVRRPIHRRDQAGAGHHHNMDHPPKIRP